MRLPKDPKRIWAVKFYLSVTPSQKDERILEMSVKRVVVRY
jgi:hypothetical protein